MVTRVIKTFLVMLLVASSPYAFSKQNCDPVEAGLFAKLFKRNNVVADCEKENKCVGGKLPDGTACESPKPEEKEVTDEQANLVTETDPNKNKTVYPPNCNSICRKEIDEKNAQKNNNPNNTQGQNSTTRNNTPNISAPNIGGGNEEDDEEESGWKKFTGAVGEGVEAVSDNEIGGAVLDFAKEVGGEYAADAARKNIDEKKWIMENCEEKPYDKKCQPGYVAANVPEAMPTICEIETNKFKEACVNWKFDNATDKSEFYSEICLAEKGKSFPQCDQSKILAESPETFKENFCKEGLWHKNEKCRVLYKESEPDVYAEEYCLKRKGFETDAANCTIDLLQSVDEEKYAKMCYEKWEGTAAPEGCDAESMKEADGEKFLSKVCKEKNGVELMLNYCTPEWIQETNEEYFAEKFCSGQNKHALCESEDEEEEEEEEEESEEEEDSDDGDSDDDEKEEDDEEEDDEDEDEGDDDDEDEGDDEDW